MTMIAIRLVVHVIAIIVIRVPWVCVIVLVHCSMSHTTAKTIYVYIYMYINIYIAGACLYVSMLYVAYHGSHTQFGHKSTSGCARVLHLKGYVPIASRLRFTVLFLRCTLRGVAPGSISICILTCLS